MHALTDSQTHSRTDTPENRTPPTPKVFGRGDITIKNKTAFKKYKPLPGCLYHSPAR